MIYLASKSPRRRQLLSQIGISFDVVDADIDETPREHEAPRDYVLRIATQKALFAGRRHSDRPLLAADTTVICHNRILGKPRDREHFLQMMDCLSGGTHRVMTAIAITRGAVPESVATALCSSDVSFRALQASEIEAYWQTGEPADKAGGYAIQGLGAAFISEIRGSYSGIMGLPLFETAQLLKIFAVNVI